MPKPLKGHLDIDNRQSVPKVLERSGILRDQTGNRLDELLRCDQDASKHRLGVRVEAMLPHGLATREAIRRKVAVGANADLFAAMRMSASQGRDVT